VNETRRDAKFHVKISKILWNAFADKLSTL
jgi:hypothetical protein